MRKEEFLRRLELLLSDIPEEERLEAMAFYCSYFEDAGIGKEDSILEELGSPEKVAAIIRSELNLGEKFDSGEGAQQEKYQEGQNAEGYYEWHAGTQDGQNAEHTHYNTYAENRYADEETRKNDKLRITLAVVVAIFTFPLWIGIVMGALGSLFGISVAAVAVTFAMFVVGIVFVGLGFTMLVSISAAVGITMLGLGLLSLAVAVLALIACIWLFGGLLPWMCKGIAKICRMIFGGNKEAQTV